MSPLLLSVALCAAPSDPPVPPEPGLHFVAQLEASGGARALAPPGAPFFFGGNLLLGLRFDPVRFGFLGGLATAAAPFDLGGFASVDVVRVKLDAQRAVALFTGVQVCARYGATRVSPWTLALLGQVGLRVLGISLTVVGGAEVPTGAGDGEVRLGVDFVELLSLL